MGGWVRTSVIRTCSLVVIRCFQMHLENLHSREINTRKKKQSIKIIPFISNVIGAIVISLFEYDILARQTIIWGVMTNEKAHFWHFVTITRRNIPSWYYNITVVKRKKTVRIKDPPSTDRHWMKMWRLIFNQSLHEVFQNQCTGEISFDTRFELNMKFEFGVPTSMIYKKSC